VDVIVDNFCKKFRSCFASEAMALLDHFCQFPHSFVIGSLFIFMHACLALFFFLLLCCIFIPAVVT